MRFGCFLVMAASFWGVAAAQVPSERVQGDVIAVEGEALHVKTRSGSAVKVTVAAQTRVTARLPGDVTNLPPGAYVGSTAVPQPDGTLLASEVHVFPEAQRGTNPGHFPLPSQPGSTMTNATVRSVAEATARSTVTNATVAGAQTSAHAFTMTLAYPGGEKVIVVPATAPVVLSQPGDRSMLVPGAHVVVYATRQPDGSLVAQRVSVGKDGYEPPL